MSVFAEHDNLFYFSVAMIKCPNKSNLKQKGFLCATFPNCCALLRESVSVLEFEVTNHIAS